MRRIQVIPKTQVELKKEFAMRRVFPCCAALTALVLVTCLLGQEGHAQNVSTLKGRYAFTLTEKCVHQLSFNVPGFDSDFHLVDPAGAETYSGASDGFMVFDGRGGARIEQGRATNIMNAPNRLTQPVITPVPLGFGLGPALSFSCHGTYTLNEGKITVPLTCDATLSLPNAFNSTGFESTFSMEGFLPQNRDHLLLTDIGNTVQPVTIFFPGDPPPSVHQERVCTRSTNLVLVSPQ
jgi:hypothetical protein